MKKKLDGVELWSIMGELFKEIARNDEVFDIYRKCLGLSPKQFEIFLDNADKGPLAVVNVVELLNDSLQNVYSFPDTPQGNADAEAKFKACHLQHNDPDGTTGVARPSDEDFQIWMADGVYDDELGYRLLLTHSDASRK